MTVELKDSLNHLFYKKYRKIYINVFISEPYGNSQKD